MMRWVVLIVLLVGLSAAGTVLVTWWQSRDDVSESSRGVAAAKPTGPQPKAVVDGKLVYEFGTLPQRTTGKHTWVVHNTGQADLELMMLSSTCSCTLAKFKDGSKAVVHPGETTDIVLEYETRENNGTYEKGAEIGTNDPSLESFSLRVKGLVYPPVLTFPPEPMVNIGTISNDTEDNFAQIAVYSLDRPETKILKVKSENPQIVCEPIELTPAEIKTLPNQGFGIKRGMKVRIHVKSGLPLGMFRDEVLVFTDHPKQSELRLAITGKMTGPVNTIPSGLSMKVYSKTGATGEVRVLVAGRRPTKFQVQKHPEKVKVEILPSEGDAQAGSYRLVVTVPPGTPPQRIEDDIVLTTDHPKAATVLVPVSIWVLNSP